MMIKPQPDKVYILYHPSWAGGPDPDKHECLFDIVTAEFDINDNLIGWRSVVTGLSESLAVKGFTEEWQDKLIPLPDTESKKWQLIEVVPE